MRVILFSSDNRVIEHTVSDPMENRCEYGGETFMYSGKDQNGTPVFVPVVD